MATAFLPIWILTALGYLARGGGLLGDAAAAGLGRFVYHIAMPATLFVTLSATPLSGFGGRSLIAFALGTAAVTGAGWLAAGRLFGRPPAERPIWGMTAGYVNSANLGIPVAQQVLGGVSFLAEILLWQVLVVTPLILIALDRHDDAAGRIRIRRIASLPLRNPVILGSLLGVVWSAWHLPVPSVAAEPLRLLAGAAVPTALIALGASLRTGTAASPESQPSGVGTPPPGRPAYLEVGVIAAVKLVAQPAVALLAGLALRLSPGQLLAVAVCAGLPTAQNTFIVAQEYRLGERLANRTVVVTTALSLGTLAAVAELLGPG